MVHNRHRSKRRTVLAAFSMLAAGLLAAAPQSARAQSSYTYIPSASATDGRFLANASPEFNTMSGDTIYMTLVSASSNDSLEFGLFDGESGGMWDQGTSTATYVLYADSLGTGAGNATLATYSGSSMTDNGWYTIKVPKNSRARTSNGSYMYLLKVYLPGGSSRTLNGFKIRCRGLVTMTANQSFSFISAMNSTSEAAVIYPSYPATTTTTFDGTWDWYMDVPTSVSTLTVWDGDMDFGNYAGDTTDSDDADTPSSIPSWATSVARAEGVALGDTSGGVARTGYPTDNSRYSILRRGQSVTYRVYAPSGTSYLNSNPSGNLEWEQFKLSTATYNSSTMDHHADSLPKGLYRVHVDGMDLGSSNSWRFGYHTLGKDSAGTAASPLMLDLTGPTLSVTGSSMGCWPPNHNMRTITMSLSSSDDRGGSVTIVLDTITGNDGTVSSDITGASYGTRDTVFSLRCEQDGSGSNRVYTIRYKATDASGNVTYATTTYEVSNVYNRGEATESVESSSTTASTAATATGAAISVTTAYPNPMHDQTQFSYTLAVPGMVTVAVYTPSAQKVRTLSKGFMEPGKVNVQWDGRDDNGQKLPSGPYIMHVGMGDCDCGKLVQVMLINGSK